ncbi:MAG: 4Fe-4S binding protein, partial [Bacteroidetes bacterium]|nr:4Fe-4S binding protein [Bacteroidota bacterium]
MKKYTPFKIVGKVFFFTGFLAFILVFFLAKYELTSSKLDEQIYEEEQKKELKQAARSMIGKSFGSSFSFVKDLGEAIDEVNRIQLEKYQISEENIKKLVEANANNQFQISSLEQVFDSSDPTNQFKSQNFRDYGGWLDGRTYENKDALKTDISNVAQNINEYGVISKKGLDKYRTKDLKYSLTKASSYGYVSENPLLTLALTFGLTVLGALLYLIPGISDIPGVKNNGIFKNAMTNGGWVGILTGSFLILFYILLYYMPEYMTNWIIMVDPISNALKGSDAGRFFLYGLMYTLAILVMGVRMLIKYRGNTYQQVRTVSVMFFQTSLAFLIPEILLRLNQPYFDFKNIWPLDYDFFFDNELNTLIESGSIGIFMLGWGIGLILVAVPVMVYFFGKRWYCSWVCGCGGLAETLGDPYRQLSSKKLKSWKVERWMVHGVLVFAIIMTAGVLYTYWTGSSQILGLNSYSIREVYGFWIGAGFAGVVGTGFYPLMGNRVWCRFGCPLAAYLGIVQRFKSRFRITTNGGQCISCGNCSTYCEMGIDVRW